MNTVRFLVFFARQSKRLPYFAATAVVWATMVVGCQVFWPIDDYEGVAAPPAISQDATADGDGVAGFDAVAEVYQESGAHKDVKGDKGPASDSTLEAEASQKESAVHDGPPVPAPPVERQPSASNPADCDPSKSDLFTWNNGSGVYAEDSATAWVSAPESSCATTCFLHAYHYDFSVVPDNAIITGIRLRAAVKWSGKLTNFCQSTYIDWGLRSFSGFPLTPAAQDNPVSLEPGDHVQWIQHGGDGDLWGFGSVTGAQIKSSDFGVFTYVYLLPPASRIDVDVVYVQVWYSVPP
jgi:hypothetical protein